MARSKASLVTLVMVMSALSLALREYGAMAQCESRVPELIANCERFVGTSGPKIPPSSECCSVIQNADVPCLCRLITPPVERIISMEKVVYVARTCGVTLQPGAKCGSYTIPPAAA